MVGGKEGGVLNTRRKARVFCDKRPPAAGVSPLGLGGATDGANAPLGQMVGERIKRAAAGLSAGSE